MKYWYIRHNIWILLGYRVEVCFTSLLDVKLYGGAHRAQRADGLALILALILGRHAGDPQRARGKDQVASVLGQGAAPPRPGDDGLGVAAGLTGEVHRVTLQHQLVMGGHCELGGRWATGTAGELGTNELDRVLSTLCWIRCLQFIPDTNIRTIQIQFTLMVPHWKQMIMYSWSWKFTYT